MFVSNFSKTFPPRRPGARQPAGRGVHQWAAAAQPHPPQDHRDGRRRHPPLRHLQAAARQPRLRQQDPQQIPGGVAVESVTKFRES